MRRVPLEHTRDVIRAAFWPLPSVCVAAAVALGIRLVSIDHAVGTPAPSSCSSGHRRRVRSVLSWIIQAMITFGGLVFSITIVVLQPTGSQS